MILLVEFEEGRWQDDCQHLHCLSVYEDYYNPVVICKTRDDLLEWVEENLSGDITVNGDTIVVDTKNWRGELKNRDIYHMVEATFNKRLVY